MGTYTGEKNQGNHHQELEKITKTRLSCMWSLVVSLAGGLVLGWWEYQYHPTNTQQWMVPFGLILMVTPMIISFAVFVSETCSPIGENVSMTSHPAIHVRDSVTDAEKCSRVITV